MIRFLTIVFVLAGLGLVAPPAYAAVSVTINASATTVPEGGRVTFTGRAVEARLGSVVRLQRRRPDGSWARVSSTRLVETRRYGFTTTPPRGYQRYRVLKPRQLGQRRVVSRVLTIKVTWHPGVALGTVTHEVVDWSTGAVVTSTGGTTTDLPGGTELRREVRSPDGTWALDGSVRTAADRSWSDSFPSTDGQRLRYVAPTSGARLATASSSVVVDGHWTPALTASAVLDRLTDVATATGDTTGLSEGAMVQLQMLSGDQWYDKGSPVAVGADGAFSSAFQANMSATYRFFAPESGLRRSAASEPFQIADAAPARVQLDTTTAVAFPAGSTTRTLVVALQEGQTFTYYGPYGPTVAVTDPSGNSLPGFGRLTETATAVAPLTGDYAVTMTVVKSTDVQNANITLSAPVVVDTAIDAAPVDLTSSLPAQLVDLRFDGTAGAVVSEYAPAHSGAALTLLDPTGSPVPQWGFLVRQGKVWRLPASGRYTLRFTPRGGDVVAQHGQEVLSASEGTMTLDGAPARVTLDRPGRVGVVSVDVPAGLDVRISDTGSAYKDEELFGPDGQHIQTYDTSPDIRQTVAGTYTQLVSDPSASAPGDVDYYATTPAEVGPVSNTPTTFDLGPAPDRAALVRVPVTSGQLFSLEMLDSSGAMCGRWVTVESGQDLVDWVTQGGSAHPAVFEVAGSGDLVVGVTPCTSTGSVRVTPASVVTPTLTDSTVDDAGYTTDTHTMTIEATQPGQVMLVDYDPSTTVGRLDLRATASTFPADTGFRFAWCYPTSTSSATGTSYPVPWDSLGLTSAWGYVEHRYYIVYAGPTATGTLDLKFTFLHQ